MPLPPCSLLIATYNWPKALELCLHTVLQQSVLPNEIIIADDGSKPPTTDVIKQFTANSPVPVVHVWHPDAGFQLAQIRNKAFAKAQYDYVIQIDGDLLLHPHFIADHLAIAKPNHFVSGSRVLLSEKTTQFLLQQNTPFQGVKTLGNDKNFFNGLRLPAIRNFLADKYKQSGKNTYYVKGCNMAFWKNDLLAVNGYNEAFTGWGREDSELAIRLINTGIKKRFLKMGGVSYHLWHKEASRDNEATNTAMMEKAIQEKHVWAPKGINQYL
jgi:glycosyltransferase involved in cell wall biosynthesis